MQPERIKISSNKGFIITKEWFKDAWRYKAKKHSINLGFLWIPGWGEGSVHMKVEYFDTLEEARYYVEKIKTNWLKG